MEQAVNFAKNAAPVISAIGGVAGIASSILGMRALKDAPQAPTLQASLPSAPQVKQTEMPAADTAATMEAKRRAIMAASQRGGRVSTMLTRDSGGTTFGG